MDNSQKPSLTDMREWRDGLVGDWGTAGQEGSSMSLDQAMKDEEDLYFQRFEVRAPAKHMAVKTGSAPSDCDAAIDSIVPTDVQIRVKPARAQKKYEDQSDKLARFGRGILHAWRSPTYRDPLRMIASDMVIRRVGVARVTVDDRLWTPRPADISLPEDPESESEDDFITRTDWEIKNRKSCPILLEDRNPRYVRWRDHKGELLVVVEHYQTTVLEVQFTYSSDNDAVRKVCRGRNPRDTVWVSEIWFGAFRCVLLEDEPLFPVGRGNYRGVIEHGYRAMPYVIAPFRELNFETPALRYRGMLTNAASLYPAESNVLSMHMAILAWNAWRTFVGWTKDNRDIEVIPGQMIHIDKRVGEYIEMLMGEPVPPELLQTASVMDNYIQRNGVAQGPRTQEGTRSAQQVWAIQSIRQLKIEVAKQSMQALVTRCLSLAAQMVQYNLGDEPLILPIPGVNREGEPMGSVTLGANDVDDYIDAFDVSFGRRIDPAVIQQATAVMGMALNKWMPNEVSYELSGLTDSPSEWTDALLRQSVAQSPLMVQMATLKQLEHWFGKESDQYQIAVQMTMQGGAGGPTPGNPGGGTMQPSAMPRVPNAGGANPPSGGSGTRAGGTGGQGQTAPIGGGGGGAPGETAGL